MLQTLLICFREGLEAFLVVAIASMYLRKIGLERLLGAVRWGLASSLGASIALGVVLARVGSMSPAWEGGLALLAAAAVAACVFHLAKAEGRAMGAEITQRLQGASDKAGSRAWWSVFGFTAFMVGREGLEAAAMIASLAAQTDARPMAFGGAAGFALAGALACLWTRHGRKVRIERFFKATAWFMGALAIQLMVVGIHEFSEIAALPLVDNAWLHAATEDIAQGTLGAAISIGAFLATAGWLAWAQIADAKNAPAGA